MCDRLVQHPLAYTQSYSRSWVSRFNTDPKQLNQKLKVTLNSIIIISIIISSSSSIFSFYSDIKQLCSGNLISWEP